VHPKLLRILVVSQRIDDVRFAASQPQLLGMLENSMLSLNPKIPCAFVAGTAGL
jgi:hypothetical protein